LLGHLRSGCAHCYERLDGKLDQLGYQGGQPFAAFLSKAPLDGQILPLHIPELAQPVQEGLAMQA
jgi:hypothetical protein